MTIKPFDRAADHIEATARRLPTLSYTGETSVSPADREAVVRFMTTTIEWKTRWGSGRDFAPWHMVGDAVAEWRSLAPLMKGHDFRDCLSRALELAGSGFVDMATAPSFDATAEETIEATRQAIIDAREDGEIDEDDAAILALPPAVLVAVQVRMQARFVEALREEPELLLRGSVETVQRDIADRWRRVLEWLVAQGAQSA